tara:strand:- start:2567 stop:2938 length:372 start_codon:yes stop_codon:yes gene_type:complete
MPNSFNNLPPELQARITSILSQGQAHSSEQVMPTVPAPSAVSPSEESSSALAQKAPSLMDHVCALRSEVNALSKQMHASAQVTEAVGNAVTQLYNMFREQTQPTNYSANFQTQKPSLNDDDDF